MINGKTPDKRLVKQLKGGCYDAFEILYERYSKSIYLTAKKFHLSHEDAENIVQDVFLKVWEKKQDLKTEYSFFSYLFTIAKNAIFKQLKKRIFISLKEEYSFNNLLTAPDQTESKLLKDDFKVQYQGTIRKLTPSKKKIFILRYHLGLSNQEIAHRLGLSRRTVESHLHQIKSTIREHLGKAFHSNNIILIIYFEALYKATSYLF